MNKIKQIGSIIALLFLSGVVKAQTDPNKLDPMTTNGKIYVVMTVVVVIVVGLLLYLVSLDRKISKIEKSKIRVIEN